MNADDHAMSESRRAPPRRSQADAALATHPPADSAKPRNRRSYDDGCAAAHALDLIGERWALLVVRELLLGPRRFSDLRQTLGGISPNVLSQRLTDLEAANILQRRQLPPPAACQVYGLTPWGLMLEPVILELLKWGVRSPGFQRGRPLSADAMALSMKALYDPELAAGFDGRITLIMDHHAYHLAIGQGVLAVARGEPPCHPQDAASWAVAVLQAPPIVVLQLAYGKRPLAHALAAGDCRQSGDTDTLLRFLSCFQVPPAIPGPAACYD